MRELIDKIRFYFTPCRKCSKCSKYKHFCYSLHAYPGYPKRCDRFKPNDK